MLNVHEPGQWIESATDWAIRVTDWGLFPDWVPSHAQLADPICPMPNKRKSWHSGLPLALSPGLPNWVVQSVLLIAIHPLLDRFYPLASEQRFPFSMVGCLVPGLKCPTFQTLVHP